jgi:hypothetical protein
MGLSNSYCAHLTDRERFTSFSRSFITCSGGLGRIPFEDVKPDDLRHITYKQGGFYGFVCGQGRADRQ